MADSQRRGPAPRSASADPLMREVRRRLFRRDELPARLRRLERLEQVALPRRNGEGPGPSAERDDH